MKEIKSEKGAGRGRRVISPEKLRSGVEDYIFQCNEEDVFPDLAGMRLFLGRSREEMEEMESDQALKKVLDYAADCRESWLVRHMCSDNKLTTGCLNALRQSCNGGYQDKAPQPKPRLVIEFTGNISKEDFL